jgi:site-specific DNA-methyltransferase (adenine-specific)
MELSVSDRERGTKTSSFGTPGRISHDSTPFYTSKLYAGLPKERQIFYAAKVKGCS